MSKQDYQLPGIAIGILSIITAVFDRTISIGLIFGYLCIVIYYLLLTKGIDAIIHNNGKRTLGNLLLYLVRMVVLTLPLLVSALHPNVSNIFGAFFGLMSLKVYFLITAITRKG